MPGGDITTDAVFPRGGDRNEGFFLAKEDLVVSGIDLIKQVFAAVDPSVTFIKKSKDGDFIKKGASIAIARGRIGSLLKAERVALNFLQHLSGVATLTRAYVKAIHPYRTTILDTRKTLPGLRDLEKKAVRDGGGKNHRMSLSDQYLIKDNHVEAAGSVTKAIGAAKLHQKKNGLKRVLIEVETKNLKEVREAVSEGVDIILLDNMTLSQIKKAVVINNGKALLEVSGGVNLRNVKKMASSGVSRISIGRLTHSAPAVDISFEIGKLL